MVFAEVVEWLESRNWPVRQKAVQLLRLLDEELAVPLALADLVAAEREVLARNNDSRTASAIASELCRQKRFDPLASLRARAKAAATPAKARAGKTTSVSEMALALANMANEMGIKALGKERYQSELAHAIKLYQGQDAVAYAIAQAELTRAAHAESAADAHNKVDKYHIAETCITYMGAPRLQMQSIMAADGELSAVGRDKEGKDLKLEHTQAMAVMHQWLKNNQHPKTLMLCGPSLIGKTTASLLPLYFDARDNPSDKRLVSFYSAHQLAKITSSYDPENARQQATMYRVRTLIIDNVIDISDMPFNTGKQFRGVVTDLLDQRQNKGLATILTTTLERREFGKMYGDTMRSHFELPRGNWVTLSPVKIDQNCVPKISSETLLPAGR